MLDDIMSSYHLWTFSPFFTRLLAPIKQNSVSLSPISFYHSSDRNVFAVFSLRLIIMDRRKIYQILTLLSSALAVIGCVFLGQLFSVSTLEAVTTVTLNENVSKELKVDLYDIVPGSERTYTINISYEYEGDMRLTMSFDGGSNKGDLHNYLSVSFTSANASYEKPLCEAFESDAPFDMGIDVKNVVVSYKMWADIGNEAQDAYADFSLILLAKRA